MGTKEHKEAQQQLEKQEQRERLEKLLTGRIKPPTEMVGYSVDQARKIMAEAEQGTRQLQQHKTMVAQLETRIAELRGMHGKCMDDIRHWDARAKTEAAGVPNEEPKRPEGPEFCKEEPEKEECSEPKGAEAAA